LSWKDAKGSEKLWLSEGAKVDGSKAVRGGVPLVFPVFGTSPDHAATSKLPQHGFARISRWEFLGKSTSESSSTSSSDGDSSVKLDFGLSPSNLTEESRKAWPYEFGLIYSVTLNREGLNTSLMVRNEGETAWEFQILLHSYLRVKDITKTSITGLESSPYIDKVGGVIARTSPSSALTISGETDRVYTPANGPMHPVTVSEGDKKMFGIVRDNLEDVVVWNPWEKKVDGMADFAPKSGWKEMLCVEAGAVKGWQKLEAGETFEGGQVVMAAN